MREAVLGARVHRLAEVCLDGLQIVGAEAVGEVPVVAQGLARLVAEDGLVMAVPEDMPAAKVPVPHAKSRTFDRQAQPLLTLSQRRFGPLPLGDVEDEGDGLLLAEQGKSDQHGNASSVLADVLLFVGAHAPSPPLA